MRDDFLPVTCEKCNRAYNVSNPLVELAEDRATARCPHCGQETPVDEETLERARAFRDGVKPPDRYADRHAREHADRDRGDELEEGEHGRKCTR